MQIYVIIKGDLMDYDRVNCQAKIILKVMRIFNRLKYRYEMASIVNIVKMPAGKKELVGSV